MIDTSTYEYLGDSLTEAGENLNYNIGEEYLKLNEKVIEDTENLISAKNVFIGAVSYYVLDFLGFFDNDKYDFITIAYKMGFDYGNWWIKQDKREDKPTPTNKINNGAFMARAQNIAVKEMAAAPAPLKGLDNHLSWYNIIKESAKSKVKNAGLQVLRSSNDLYKKVAIMVSEKQFKEGNVFTRRQMSQELLNEFANRGITGIVYRNGARYSIDTYCGMLGRTLAGRTAVQASINRFSEMGYNLAIVSSHFRCCDLCAPYEGTILSLDGKSDKYPSIWDAETQGLFHPNCKHSISAFFEGFTPPVDVRMDQAERDLVNQYGYSEAQKITFEAQQKQRYIERKIRQWKRREQMQLDDINKKRAQNKIRQWQAVQRTHLNNNTFLKRQYSREQIQTAH